MSTAVRLMIHEDPMGEPMWNDVVIVPPRSGEIVILPFGHFRVDRIYHHANPLPRLRPGEYKTGVCITAILSASPYSPGGQSREKWMNLCEGGLESMGWVKVPKDERFWVR